MKTSKLSGIFGLGGALALACGVHGAPLTAGDPVPLPGTKGGCDFIRVDTNAGRLLLGHEHNKSFDVFDLSSKTLLKIVPTSTSQDAAVDVKRGNYYVSGNDPARMVIVNTKDLSITGEVPLPSDADLIGFDESSGLVHVCNDKAAEEWVIDPDAKKIVTTITFDGKGLEDLAFGPHHKRLFQAVKGSNTIAVVDAVTNKVLNAWPLAPDKSPHGIAVVPDSDGLLVACAGSLVLLDRETGKILDRAKTAPRVDEMAYDPGLHVAYCASRMGQISVVGVAADKLTPLGDVPDQQGTGSIAVDPKTHTVWVASHKGDDAFVQPFTPAK